MQEPMISHWGEGPHSKIYLRLFRTEMGRQKSSGYLLAVFPDDISVFNKVVGAYFSGLDNSGKWKTWQGTITLKNER